MKANVLRREFPSVAFQTPEEKVERLTGSLTTKINLEESLESRYDSLDRTMYTTNTTWARNRPRGQTYLKPMEQNTQQRGHGDKGGGERVKQVFYWGHERKNPPQKNPPPSTKTTQQFPSSKVRFDPRFDQDRHTKSGKVPYTRQMKASSQSQSGSCPTQIYSKFKTIHSEKMNRTYPQQVNINGHVQMDHYARRRTHLQPLRLGYETDKPRIENTSYYQATERAPSWKSDVLPTSSARSTTGSYSNSWPLNMDVEDRQGDRWSPFQNSFDTVPIGRTNSLSHEYRWDFMDWPVPPPNSVTPSSLETGQPPPNTPNEWW
eukprot:XP_003730403.1 PREDICTED: uncharacterized protein LOC100887914 [Strongylocentrotus purpuratus]